MTAAALLVTAPECSPPAAALRPRPARGYASGKDDYLSRLAKIEGQVRGQQKMVQADTWCPDVVVQVASAIRALQEVAVGLLNDHVHHCVVTAVRASEADGEASLAEVARTIRQVIRLWNTSSLRPARPTARSATGSGPDRTRSS